MKNYVIRKDNFEIEGVTETPFNDENRYTIQANDIEDAKYLRDSDEAFQWDFENINIKVILEAINNTERAHGSSDINPRKLKENLRKLLMINEVETLIHKDRAVEASKKIKEYIDKGYDFPEWAEIKQWRNI